MAVHARRHGYALRPVAKVHKSTQIARLQSEAGALGTCCSTLAEAEVMVDAGIAGVLLFTSVVTPPKLERLAALNARAEGLLVAVDDAGVVAGVADAARALGPAAAGARRRRGRRRPHRRGRPAGGRGAGAAGRGGRRAGVRGRAGLQREPPGDGRLRRAPRRRGRDDGAAARLRRRARGRRPPAADRVRRRHRHARHRPRARAADGGAGRHVRLPRRQLRRRRAAPRRAAPVHAVADRARDGRLERPARLRHHRRGGQGAGRDGRGHRRRGC